MTQPGQPGPEEDAAPFTRAIDVSGLHEAVEIEARASEPECAAAARLLQLERIEALSGRATVKPQGGGRFILEGAFKAAVHPVCVVSLAPFRQELSGRFKRHYTLSPPPEATPGGEIELGADDSLYPDAIPGGALDFGIVLTEELALALDPFPRAPGAVFQAPEAAPEGADSPFAALAQLKKP